MANVLGALLGGMVPTQQTTAPASLQPMPAPIPDNLAQHFDVSNHMKVLWRSVGNGGSGIEAGFRVDVAGNTAEGMSVVPHPASHQYHKAVFPMSASTVAEFHIHPNGTSPEPSSIDTTIADKHKVDVYTFGQRGVYKYDYQTRKTSRVIDGTDWLK